MLLNILGWGFYFLQSCFSSTSTALTEEDGVCDTMQRIITNGQCCVCDPEEKTDARCCSFQRAYKSSPSFFCFGHVTDSQEMSDVKFAALNLAKQYKVLLFIFACIFSVIGLICVISPGTVVFNVVVSDEFREQLGIQEEKNKPMDEQLHKETVMSMLKSSMNGLSSLFDNSDEISRDEVIKIRDMLTSVQNNLIYNKPEAVAVTEPTSILGGAFLFYALMCVYQLSMSTCQLLDLKNVYLHGIWFGCGIVAIIAASSGHGRNMENSKFVIALIVFYVLGAVAFIILERMMHGFMHKYPRAIKHEFMSNDSSDSDSSSDEESLQKNKNKNKNKKYMLGGE